MRQLILFLLLFSLTFSCKQKQKNSESEDKNIARVAEKLLADSNNIEKQITVDSLSDAIGNYIIISQKSYFFDTPDLSKKRKDYLKKDQLVLVSKIANGFAYARPSDFADSLTNGWLLLSDLKQIFFTPPKISGER